LATGASQARSVQERGSLDRLTFWTGWTALGGLLIAWAFTLTTTHALAEMHAALEQVVRLLN
jgi:hypothetical protein